MKRIIVLGSTGSIGTQTLDVASRLKDRIQVVALSACSNDRQLLQQARQFGCSQVALTDLDAAERLQRAAPDLTIHAGDQGLEALARDIDGDLVVVAVAGVCGLPATLAAIDSGKAIALASKEVLVAAGQQVMERAVQRGVSIVPVDSEHSAIFQCLQGYRQQDVARLLITSSGGAVRRVPIRDLPTVTAEQALRHPNWSMGAKITIDSATLMNKALEIIEAHWLFGIPVERIEVLIHPQSIVHSLVELRDGSVLAQLGLPDMRLPIQLALLHPERLDTGLPRLDLAKTGALTFRRPSKNRYPALRLAIDALEAGGVLPAAMNGANEAAVQRFLNREIRFTDIVRCVRSAMRACPYQEAQLDNILRADREARAHVAAWTP